MPVRSLTLPHVTDSAVIVATIRDAALLVQADASALPFAEPFIDLTVTSPPYGAGIVYDAGGDVVADEWPALMRAWLAELHRVTKPSGRLALNVPLDMLTGAERLAGAKLARPTYHQALTAAEAAGWLHAHTLVWDKAHHKTGNRGLGSLNSSARPCPIDPSEAVIFLTKGPWGPSSARPDSITPAQWQEYNIGPWRFPGLPRQKGGHPAPFPEELARRCIRLLSRSGDVVFDPFSGSGTTVAVAVAEGRIGAGSDRSRKYLGESIPRIEASLSRLADGRRCAMCDTPIGARRRDAWACSARCRQRARRRRGKDLGAA